MCLYCTYFRRRRALRDVAGAAVRLPRAEKRRELIDVGLRSYSNWFQDFRDRGCGSRSSRIRFDSVSETLLDVCALVLPIIPTTTEFTILFDYEVFPLIGFHRSRSYIFTLVFGFCACDFFPVSDF